MSWCCRAIGFPVVAAHEPAVQHAGSQVVVEMFRPKVGVLIDGQLVELDVAGWRRTAAVAVEIGPGTRVGDAERGHRVVLVGDRDCWPGDVAGDARLQRRPAVAEQVERTPTRGESPSSSAPCRRSRPSDRSCRPGTCRMLPALNRLGSTSLSCDSPMNRS